MFNKSFSYELINDKFSNQLGIILLLFPMKIL